MKTWAVKLAFCFFISIFYAVNAPAAVFYVDLNCANPTPPYADWSTAATNIQDAIDASSDGDQIWVTNGIYQTGGRVVYGSLTNRVVINKGVTVQSVNGPAVTTIQGYQVPGTINGDSAVRCVYLTNNAVLIGFTLTNGATRNLFSGDAVKERSGGGAWCESASGLISNCIVAGNSCFWFGAGVYSGTVSDCQIINNTNRNGSEGGGGGVAYSILFNSTISSNYLDSTGSGAFSCTLSNCVVACNSGGGVLNCVLNYCTIENNTNNFFGGGAMQSTLNNCLLYNNQALNGGGAYQCELNLCTVSNNWAGARGGGVYEVANSTNKSGLNNLLVGNSAGLNGGGVYFSATSSFLLTNWNFSGWMFTSNSAVSDGGGLYFSTPSSSALNNCTFSGNSTGGNGGGFSCNDNGGAFTVVSNCIFNSNIAVGGGGGAYDGSLNNCVVIGNQAGSGGGVYGIVSNSVVNNNVAKINGGGIFYNSISSPELVLNNCALTNNSAINGGGAYGGNFSNCIFFANYAVTNGGGIYNAALNNCLVISNQAAFGGGASVGGDTVPLYPGTQAIYIGCNFFGNSATDGGGIYNTMTVINCLLESNSATNNGGGGYGGILVNCLLTGNSAMNGGGAYGAGLDNSTLVENTATSAGGGTYYPTRGNAVSCIIYDNSAPNGANFAGIPAYSFCCLIPLPSGSGNITNDPVFVNLAAGNFRLQTNSPCINLGSGNPGTTDLDGRHRVVGGRIDIGAYEFQGAGIGEFIAWLQQYGLPTDGSADFLDPDGDGMNNWQEWKAGTIPTNAASVLELSSPSNSVSGLTVTWQSVGGMTYYLQSSTNLTSQPAFSSIQSNIVGQIGSTSYTDTTATNDGPYFYRVGVQ